MILASAQIQPIRFDVAGNIRKHLRFIEKAANSGARLIVFPEMSLTGYEREQAEKYKFLPKDSRLEPLQKLSDQYDIIVVAGAPLETEDGFFIGSFIFQPNQPLALYTKQFLHGEESLYFKPSNTYDPMLRLEDRSVSLAICADIDHPEHAAAAGRKGANYYLPSIFFSPGGIPEAYIQLAGYAKDFGMNVLMSNFCGDSWGYPAGGGSAFWDQQGNLQGKLSDQEEGILLVDDSHGHWKCSVLPLQ